MADIVRQLRYIQEKYKNDIVSTGRVVISDIARDCANEIERLQSENRHLKAEIERLEDNEGGHLMSIDLLVARLKQVEAERDKAVEDMHGNCEYCVSVHYELTDTNSPCYDCVHIHPDGKDNFVWRGLEESK